MPIEASPLDLDSLRRVLRAHVPEIEAWAFGSRVQGVARPFSDLDVVLMADEPLPLARLARLKEALSESAFPFKVDLVEWSRIPERFKAVIRERHEVVYRPESTSATP